MKYVIKLKHVDWRPYLGKEISKYWIDRVQTIEEARKFDSYEEAERYLKESKLWKRDPEKCLYEIIGVMDKEEEK